MNLVDIQLASNPQFSGEVAHIKMSDEETGFHILDVRLADGKSVTVKGTHLAPIAPGDKLTVSGTWERHASYGAQIKASEMAVELPTTGYGVYKWLSRGKIKGVGDRTASKLYEAFGDGLLEALEDGKDLTTAGITAARATAIHESWKEQRDIAKLESFLLGYDINKRQVREIVDQYGGAGYSIVSKNPWRLASEIEGIGFNTADKIGLRGGLGMEHPERIKSGVEQALRNLSAEYGHVFYPRDQLVHNLPGILNVSKDLINIAIDDLEAEGRICTQNFKGRALIYSKESYLTEKAVALHTARLLTRDMAPIKTEPFINSVAKAIRRKMPQFAVTDGVRAAVEMAFSNPLSILTGGPGTGKTSTVNFIVKVAISQGMSVALAGPTGMASNRLSEVTGLPACTLHSLFKIMPESNRANARKAEPLDHDLVIIDEKGMVNLDNTLAALRNIGPNTRVLLVGDPEQLPAIGKGLVLQDMLKSGAIPFTRLDVIHRTAGMSGIPDAARDVNNGIIPKNNRDDFQLFYENSPAAIHNGIVRLVTDLLPRAGYTEDDIMVLAPMKKGPIGTHELNKSIKRLLRPVGEGSSVPYFKGKDDFFYSIGDPVLQQKTKVVDEEKGIKLVNGDVGRIVSINPQAQGEATFATVDYNLPGGVLASYSRAETSQFIPAYAKTIHKAQGSENRVVIVPIHSDAGRMLERALFYTAITRGKEKVIVIGDEAGLKKAVENTRSLQRNTLLAERLPAYINQMRLELNKAPSLSMGW